MKTIAIISQKGGAGKSTMAIALAGEAHRLGKHAAILDADEQGTADKWGQRRGKDVMPVSLYTAPEDITEKLDIARESGFDLVILDTAGHATKKSIAYARAADLVIIPVRGCIADTDAVALTVKMVNDMGLPHSVVVNGLQVNSRLLFKELTSYLEDEYEATVAPVYLAYRSIFRKCHYDGKTPQEVENDRRGKGTREITALYTSIMNEMAEVTA